MENAWFDVEIDGVYIDSEMVEDLLREAIEDANPRVANICDKALGGSLHHFNKAAAILEPRLRRQYLEDDMLDARV